MTDATLSTVRNAARLLKAFLAREDELGVSELARRLGLGKSSVHRLLATLLDEGMVEQDQRTGQYRLGLTLFELGEAVRSQRELSKVAGPVLAALRDRTGESTQLGVAHGPDVVYLERLESQHTPRLVGDQRRAPLHCTAEGKVLLAFRPEAGLAEYLSVARLVRLTGRTLTDPAALRGDLTAVRHRGWAESVNEREVGVASLAAPVRDVTGAVVASVGVIAPIGRFRSMSRTKLAEAVFEAAQAVSRRLGFAVDNDRVKES